MAKISGTLAWNSEDTRWAKASDLYQMHEEARLSSLELIRLKSLFPNGLQRGSIFEISGERSSGRTSISLYVLTESISRGETCAYIDLANAFQPAYFEQAAITLDQLCWVRCNGNTEHAMRSADLLLHAGGFGVVLLDLCGARTQTLNRIPPSYWFRFQRAIEHTPTILLLCCEHQQARSCARYSLAIKKRKSHWTGEAPFAILTALESSVQTSKPFQTKVTSIRPESLLIHTGVV